MLAFTTLPATSAGAPATGVLADRPAGSSTDRDTASESFASTLSAIAGESEETGKDDASFEDPTAIPVVPVTDVLSNTVQPGASLAWTVTVSAGEAEGLQAADPLLDTASVLAATGRSNTDAGIHAVPGANVTASTFGIDPAATQSDGVFKTAAASLPGVAAHSKTVPLGEVPVSAGFDSQPTGPSQTAAIVPDSGPASHVTAQAVVDTFTTGGLAEAIGAGETPGVRLPNTSDSGDAGEQSASATSAASDAGEATSATPAASLRVRPGLADELRQALAGSGEEATASRPRTTPETTSATFPPELAAGARQSRDGSLSFDFSGNSGLAKAFSATVKANATSFASALANVPEFESLPTETANQIVQALRMQFARGGGEAQIRLSPQHFGELKVSIKVDSGQVTARLEAEVPAVREWLQTNQSLLRSSLAEQRLTLDHLEVSEPHESRDAEREREHTAAREERQKQQRRRRRDDTGEIFEVVA